MKKILLIAAIAAFANQAHAAKLWTLWMADDPHITATRDAADPLGLSGTNWYRMEANLLYPDDRTQGYWSDWFEPLEADGFNFESLTFFLFDDVSDPSANFVFENPFNTPDNFVSFDRYNSGSFAVDSHEFQWLDFVTETFDTGPYAGWFLDVHMSDAIITAQIIHEAGSYDPYVYSGWLNHGGSYPAPDSSTTLPLLGLAVGAIAIASRRFRKS